MVNNQIKFPTEHYVGMIVRKQSGDKDYLPLAFMTPEGTDKAADNRKASVDQWVANNSTGYDYATRTRYTIKQPKPVVLKNEPLAGFRLLDEIKRDSSWGSGNVKWRVEDPRGFELEISSPNLMQILSCSVVDGGEILDRCMWARQGKDNVLVPVSSEVYKTAVENTQRAGTSVSTRNLKLGSTVVLQNGVRGRYYGKMNAVHNSRKARSNAAFNDICLEMTPRHIIIDAVNGLHTIASLKLAEIMEGEELSREEAERAINALPRPYGTHYFTFAKSLPAVTREKMEVEWGNYGFVAFHVDGVWWYQTTHDHNGVIEAMPVPRVDQWETNSYLHPPERTYYYQRDRQQFKTADLVAGGVKAYRPSSRLTAVDGSVYLVKH